jgi:hypothetical protein
VALAQGVCASGGQDGDELGEQSVHAPADLPGEEPLIAMISSRAIAK